MHAAPPPPSSLHGCARRLHLVAAEAPAIFLRLTSRRWIGVLRVGATHAEGRAAAFYRPRDGARRRGPRQDRVECG